MRGRRSSSRCAASRGRQGNAPWTPTAVRASASWCNAKAATSPAAPAAARDAEGKKLKTFSGPGGGEHQANFIAAVRSRKESDLAAPIEGGHLSSALCHLGNISYRLGQNRTNDALRDVLAADANAKDSFDRMLEHLRANEVDVAKVPTVSGPTLALAPGQETFVSKEKYDLGFWANTMLRREYRAPFVVPEIV